MPLNTFVIRPFGQKPILLPGKDEKHDGEDVRVSKVLMVDFERVHEDLIKPALLKLNITPHTTEAVLQAGNIREDMFHLLMTADLVVADITYHNPNVFYELGIRHAFRDRFTFLIRSEGPDEPFDLKTDRYFTYDYHNLKDSIDNLAKAIRSTICSERTDSPVFRLLPRTRTEDRARFISVPHDFLEAVERARQHRRCGDLRLLAVECQGFLWEVEGLREVGRAQFDLNFMHSALTTWKEIVQRYPNDVEANMVLSTVYQRVSDATRADQALARIAKISIADINTVAEIRSLTGRNFKAKWCDSWHPELRQLIEKPGSGNVDAIEDRKAELRESALRSPLLRKARQEYLHAYHENLNYIYAGLNALGLMLIEYSLASEFQKTWESMAESEDQARAMLRELRVEIDKLTIALGFAISVERKRLAAGNRIDFWFEIEEAAFLCMTVMCTEKVKQNYLEALAWAPESAERSMRPALVYYQDLQVRHLDADVNIQANLTAALDLIKAAEAQQKEGDIILFAGLRITPSSSRQLCHAELDTGEITRFLSAELADRAKREIHKAIEAERANGRTILFGMAAGANGSDLLFHEACDELDIKTRMYLALSRDQYVGEYVAPAGAEWIDRFNKVYASRGADRINRATCALGSGDYESDSAVNVLADSAEMPRWLQSKSGYTVGRRNAVWMLQHALVQRSLYGVDKTNITMIALWDCREIEASGAIADLVHTAEKNGVKVIHLDCSTWSKPAVVAESVVQNQKAPIDEVVQVSTPAVSQPQLPKVANPTPTPTRKSNGRTGTSANKRKTNSCAIACKY
jgi:hypothetical protein